MNLSKDDIIELMTKARSLGASHIKADDFEVYFNQKSDRPQPAFAPHSTVSIVPASIPDAKFEDLIKPVSPFDEMTDEEIMYWGTAYGDELIAKRKAREEELKTETRATGRNRSKPQGDSDVQKSSTQ